ncbi:DUF1963 domain-containing protein [Streptomyces sp. NPDC005492]|uniref:DUF1963 domain-containing protein n=1 Tax=Streptomyces sp. NPDC005492 TaxID=3156883 RepID=UPI0033A120AD
MTSIGEALLLKTAAEHGVPGPVARELLARCRPCLYLVRDTEVPESLREHIHPAARTGGLPALPDGVDWPEGREPLMLSVGCAALPRDVLDIELPADGHLLFFTEISYPPERSAVLHVPAGTRTSDRSATYELSDKTMETKVYAPRTLYPVPGLSIEQDGEEGPETCAFVDGDGDNAREALESFEEALLDSARRYADLRFEQQT